MAKKKRVEWPQDLWYNITHFKVYRKEFRKSLWWELGEANVIGSTIFTLIAIVVGVVLFGVMIGCLAVKNVFLGILDGAVLLAIAAFIVFWYLPNCGASFKECVVAADEEAYKAQLKEERDNPDDWC